MQYTFVDSVLKTIPPTRKNGRVKYTQEYVTTTDTLISILDNPFKKGERLFVRSSKVTEGREKFKKGVRSYLYLYDCNGVEIVGIWKHGRYGSKTHFEPVQVHHTLNNERDEFSIVSKAPYASGQIKDQMKYLLEIKG